MTKFKFIALFTASIAFFSFAAASLQAEESSPKVSYAKKKQGGVPFSNKEESAASEQTAEPSDIEPAAGAADVQDEKNETSLADDLKLPRK